jgi:DnaJ-domain-containing protein 1
MMPADNTQLEPPHWMAALHSIGGGRIYGYWCDGRSVTIRPIHMDWKWGKSPRKVEYGPEIDINKLRGELTYAASKWLEGYYAIADFGDNHFWKKQSSAEEREYRYTWRQWSYSRTNQHQQTEPDDEPNETWDTWEDFEKHYGEVGGEDQGFWRSTDQRRRSNTWENTSSDSRERTRQRGSLRINPYNVLGIPVNASDEEIKQAYRRKAREYHPDMHPNEKEKYTSKMADINAAFETLTKRRQRPNSD